MQDIQEQDENRLECNDTFITEVFELAFGESARDKYTNEEALLKLREFSDNALKFENKGRKIVQILQTEMDSGSFGNIAALCDDGTIWHITDDDNDGWMLLNESIPQEPVDF